MGSQRVRHNWATKQEFFCKRAKVTPLATFFFFFLLPPSEKRFKSERRKLKLWQVLMRGIFPAHPRVSIGGRMVDNRLTIGALREPVDETWVCFTSELCKWSRKHAKEVPWATTCWSQWDREAHWQLWVAHGPGEGWRHSFLASEDKIYKGNSQGIKGCKVLKKDYICRLKGGLCQQEPRGRPGICQHAQWPATSGNSEQNTLLIQCHTAVHDPSNTCSLSLPLKWVAILGEGGKAPWTGLHLSLNYWEITIFARVYLKL